MKWLFPFVCGGMVLVLAVSFPRAQDTATGEAPGKNARVAEKGKAAAPDTAGPDSRSDVPRGADKRNPPVDAAPKRPVGDRSETKRADVAKDGPKAEGGEGELKIFKLRRASADSALQTIMQLYSDEFNSGKVTMSADARTNSLLVRGPRESLEIMEAVLITLDDVETVVRGDASTPAGAGRPEMLKGRLRPPATPAAQEYRRHDEQAARIAAAYRSQQAATPSEKEKLDHLRTLLRSEVVAAFDTRQKLQRAEMERLRSRLAQIERQIEGRQQRAQQIIDSRVEELLHPEQLWEARDDASDPAGGAERPQRDWPRQPSVEERPVPEGPRSLRWGSGPNQAEPPTDPLIRAGGTSHRKALLDVEAAIVVARTSVHQANAALRKAQDRADRMRTLYQKGNVPQAQLDAVEDQVTAERNRLERASLDLEQAERQAALAREDLAAQIELLKFDLDAAALNLEQTTRDEERTRKLFEQRAISTEEADQKRLAVQQARVQYQRAKTLYELYRKALPEAESKAAATEDPAIRRGSNKDAVKKEE